METESERVEGIPEELAPNAEEEPQKSEETPSEEPTAPPLTETPEFKAALKKEQSGWDRRITTLQNELNQAQAETRKAKSDYDVTSASLKSLRQEHEELTGKAFADDPEALQGYKDKMSVAEEKRRAEAALAAANEKEQEVQTLIWSMNMNRKATEVIAETGIPMSELEDCRTEAEMENKGLRYQMAHLKEQSKPSTPPRTPKVDSGIQSQRGGKLTTEDADKLPIEEYAEHPSIKDLYK